MPARSKKEWWKTLFDEKYLNTYVDILTPERTLAQVAFLVKVLHLKKGAKILDVACAHGRHAIELARRGYNVTGLDFSKHFIGLAKEEASKRKIKVTFVRGDMRDLSFVNTFDVITNLFTAFGYFANEDDNILVLKKISRALKPRGAFLIDLNNTMGTLVRMARDATIDKKTGLLSNMQKDILSNGLTLMTKNRFDPATMRWSMTRTWKEKGKTKSYSSTIRMFSLPELEHLMEGNALRVEKVWGDFHGSFFGLEARRMIILARKM